MKTSSNRSTKQGSRLAGNLEHTFGRIDARRLGRKSLLAVGVMALLVTGAASADWRVYDQRVETVLNDIKTYIGANDPRSVNQNLDNLYKQQQLKDGKKYDPDTNKSVRAEVKDDDISAVDAAKGRRCGSEKIPQKQKPICEGIVDLEQARYKYLKDMTELSKKREEELKTIMTERGTLKDDDIGKLQSNTNRLLALLTHQRIDQVNLDMAMNLYDERIRDKREQLQYEGAVAMNPRNKTESAGPGGFDWGGLFNGTAQVAALDLALAAAKSRDR